MNVSDSDFDTDEPFKDDFNESDQSGKKDEPLRGGVEPSGDAVLSENAEVEEVDAENFNTDYPSSEGGSNKSSSVATLPPLGSHRQTRGFAGGDPSDPRNWPNIDGYIIEAYLGGGGFGTVYRAHSTKLDATVAVKVLKPEVLHRPDAVKRFSQEVTTAARNRHLHVVQVLDTGVIKTAFHERCQYMVTEFLAGGDFLGWLSEHPRTSRGDGNLRLAIEKLVQICRGLESLHQAGIVHRDIKPENVLLDQDGSPKLADFGLAGIFDEKLAEARSGKIQLPLPDDMENSMASRLTVTGDVFGTLGYMAPELFMGMQHASPASDQFSIGVMLYVILCDLRPFQAKRRDPEERVRIQQAIDNLDRQLPPPGIEPPSSKSNFRDRGLQFICMKCLRPAPELRYSDVAELRSDLEAWLSGQTVGEGLLTRVWNEKIYLPVKNRPFRYLASVAAILTAVALGFIFKNRLEYEAELLGTNNELSETNQQLETTNQQLNETKENLDLEKTKFQRQLFETYRFTGEQAAANDDYGTAALAYAAAWQVSETMRDRIASEELAVRKSHAIVAQGAPTLLMQSNENAGSLRAKISSSGQLATLLNNGRIKVLNPILGNSLLERVPQTGPIRIFCVDKNETRLAAIENNIKQQQLLSLWDLKGGELLRQDKVNFRVADLAFAPTGGAIAVCGIDEDGSSGIVQLRHFETLEVKNSRKLMEFPKKLAFHPDGQKIACVSTTKNSILRMLNNDDLSDLWETEITFDDSYCCLTFAPDGKRLAVASCAGNSSLVDVAELPVVHELTRSSSVEGAYDPYGVPLGFAKFSSDGVYLATACGDRMARAWITSSATQIGGPMFHPEHITDLDLDESGSELVTACMDGKVRVWLTPSGKAASVVMRHSGASLTAAYGPIPRSVITAGEDGLVRTWKYALPGPIQPEEGNTPRQAAISADGKKLLTQSVDAKFQTWNLSDLSPAGPEFQVGHSVHKMESAVDGKMVALAGISEGAVGRISLINTEDGERVGDVIEISSLILKMKFNPLGRWLAVIACTRENQYLVVVDVKNNKVHEFGLPVPDQIAWNPANPEQLLVGLRDSRIFLAEMANFTSQQIEANGDSQVLRDLEFSPNGKMLATTTGNEVRIWDANHWKPIGQPLRHEQEPNGVAFSTDEKLLLTFGNDRIAIVWEWTQENSEWAQKGLVYHDAAINDAEFDPSGNFFATASDDGSARLWETQSQQAVSPPLRHSSNGSSQIETQFVHFVEGNRLITFVQNNNGLLEIVPESLLMNNLKEDPKADDTLRRPLQYQSVMQVWQWNIPEGTSDAERAMRLAQRVDRRQIDSSGRVFPMSSQETIELLETVSEAVKDPFVVFVELAQFAKKEKRYEDVAKYLNKALTFDPDRGRLWYDYAIALNQIGREAEAISALGEAIENGYKESEVFRSRGRLLLDAGQVEKALSDLQIAVDKALLRDEPAFQLGTCQAYLGQFDAAAQSYDQGFEALRQFNASFDYFRIYERIMLDIARSQNQLAAERVNEHLASATEEKSLSACYYSAFAAALTGEGNVDWDLAIESARIADELSSNTIETRRCLAYVLCRAARYNDAHQIFEETKAAELEPASSSPPSPLSDFFHAICLHGLNRNEDARKAFEVGESRMSQKMQRLDETSNPTSFPWDLRVGYEKVRSEARRLVVKE